MKDIHFTHLCFLESWTECSLLPPLVWDLLQIAGKTVLVGDLLGIAGKTVFLACMAFPWCFDSRFTAGGFVSTTFISWWQLGFLDVLFWVNLFFSPMWLSFFLLFWTSLAFLSRTRCMKYFYTKVIFFLIVQTICYWSAKKCVCIHCFQYFQSLENENYYYISDRTLFLIFPTLRNMNIITTSCMRLQCSLDHPWLCKLRLCVCLGLHQGNGAL